ncbi:MAG: hypothetical protein JNN30_21495 [Rhodanobacteraceae bacterium]|nr:hypothetical protein [Rhodanobacteraceae bacterium]
MRNDLHEVLIERPRRGHRLKTARGNKPRAAEWTGEDSYADSYEPRQRRTKFFDDLLAPLRRWLRRQVGRPWNKIWSELTASIDTRSVVGRHLLDHVRQLVVISADYDAAQRAVILKPHLRRRSAPDEPVDGLYVDPRTGVLRWREPVPRRVLRRLPPAPRFDSAGNPIEFRPMAPTRGYFRGKGIWYEVEIAAIAPTTRSVPFDLMCNGFPFRITHKRQLNSRELLAAGLNNEA